MSEQATRIAWICAPGESGDSYFSVPLLRQCGHDRDPEFEVHAFLAGSQRESSLPIPVAPLAPDGMLSEILSTYDAAIFDLAGRESIAEMLPTMRRVPGVFILHEPSYQSSFVDRCFGELQSAAAFTCLMHRYHGANGVEALLNSGASSDVFPLIEPIAALASALVVHSDESQACVEAFFHGPIIRLEKPNAASDANAEDYKRHLQSLKAFVRDNTGLLQRRARFVSPSRDALPQQSHHSSDELWRQSLLRARSAHNDLERDPRARSPEPFLKWSDGELAALIANFLLDAQDAAELMQAVLSLLRRTDSRWEIYEVVCRLRWLQELAQNGPTLDGAILPTEPIWDARFWALACQVKPAAFARLLHLAILQRPWKEYEPNSWAQLVESGTSPAVVLKRFLATAECRELIPDPLRNGLTTWAEEQTLVQSLTSRDVLDEWMEDARIHFGDDGGENPSRLVGSWYAPEPAGRWTKGRSGGLSFRLPADLVSPVSLSLRLRAAGTEHTGPRNVEAYCNGHWLHSLQLTNDAPNDWVIPLNSPASRDVTIVLIADRSFSPATAGGSSDARDLGIMVIEAVLVRDRA